MSEGIGAVYQQGWGPRHAMLAGLIFAGDDLPRYLCCKGTAQDRA
ncbi:MAG: hypothetical protein ACRDP7_26760 [Trebonia sp.]